MKTIKYSLLIAIATFLFSCENRKVNLTVEIKDPTISFKNVGANIVDNTLYDSIKVSTKNGQQFYKISLAYKDPNNKMKDVSASVIYGDGYYKDATNNHVTTFTKLASISEGEVEFIYNEPSVGLNVITFSANNQYNKYTTITARITGFDNLLPVADYDVTALKINDPLEYSLDASKSKDLDSKFGGAISQYIWKINGFQIKTDRPSINYIFDKSGNYLIELSVIDNNGATSQSTKSQLITIN